MMVVVSFSMLILLAAAVYALYIETRMFRSVQVRMRIPRYAGDPLHILHISDSHFRKGDKAKLDFVRGLHEKPVDMVIVTGDMIEEDAGIEYCIEALRGFKAWMGVFVVFGAHDHWDTRLWNVVRDLSLGGYRKGEPNDFDRFKRELNEIGVICLQNESRRITRTGARSECDIWLVGIDDLFAGLEDFEKALAGVPKGACKILLTHAVESPEELVALGFAAVFAGHSHGGQVRLPLLGPIITRSSLHRKYATGLFEIDGTSFHINNGLGGGKWTNFRFLCPPEVTYVELTGTPGTGERG